jgi:hypothetical protein
MHTEGSFLWRSVNRASQTCCRLSAFDFPQSNLKPTCSLSYVCLRLTPGSCTLLLPQSEGAGYVSEVAASMSALVPLSDRCSG